MAENSEMLHEQNMSALAQIGLALQQHFASYQKVLDLDYAENKRLVGLVEALGVREVASKTVPAGPNTTAAKTGGVQ